MQTHESDLMQQVGNLVQEYISICSRKERNVINFFHPEELAQRCPVDIPKQGIEHKELLEKLTQILEYSSATIHPYFFNQLYAGADPIGIIGEYLSGVLNTSMATYETAPLFTLMEKEVFRFLSQKLGREEGTYTGLMVPGGSLSNQYSIMLARSRVLPHGNTTGLFGSRPLAIFTSEQGHYSITKSAIVLGIGKENVYHVTTDKNGSMNPIALRTAIQQARDEGKIPCYVNATAGTTVLGAFDPFSQIADVCKEEGLRMHIDACWGGGSRFTDTHHHLLSGVELADSCSFNAHKMLRVPQQCSLLMIHDSHIVRNTCSLKAAYLFQEDKGYDTIYDTGDNYIQCARKTDILKLRLMLTAYGESGIQQQVEKALTNAQLLAEKIENSDKFYLLQTPPYANVCFRRIPHEMRNETTSLEFFREHHTFFHQLTASIKAEMLRQGKMMINYQPLGDLPNFIRFISINPSITEHDLDEILIHIDQLGETVMKKEALQTLLSRYKKAEQVPS